MFPGREVSCLCPVAAHQVEMPVFSSLGVQEGREADLACVPDVLASVF